MTLSIKKQLVQKILESPLNYTWSLQGFGMLRLYLSKEVRLHVWSNAHQYRPRPDMIHDHPWSFVSWVVAGTMLNVRYGISPAAFNPNYEQHTIRCGMDGGIEALVCLFADKCECISAGESYVQRADEIHESIPTDGAVSIIERKFNEDTEHARVFIPIGERWVSAEPRMATSEEVISICRNSLERFF